MFMVGAFLGLGLASSFAAYNDLTDNDTSPVPGLAAKINDNFGALPSANLTGNIAAARLTNAMSSGSVSLPATNLTGNVAAAALTNAIVGTIQPAYTYGVFSVVDATQLVFIASGVTNVIDADIGTP